MKKLLKDSIPQLVINNFWHLPKAIIANLKFGFPSKNITVIGVTGTDGKTTTVNMIYKILKDAGKRVSMVSTINAVVGNKFYDTGFHVTSPDPFDVQQYIKNAAQAGSEIMVLEVTSHSLDQYRFWGIVFKVGVITNITHEHLDYHKTYNNYLNTKVKLIKNSQQAVINVKLFQNVKRSFNNLKSITTFGISEGDFNQKDLKLKLSIPGDYNIENGLAAVATTSVLAVNTETSRKSLQSFTGLSGRMEEVKNNKGIKIFVDFAHTPNALENALKTLRKQTNGKLIAVFGSAGKRDVEKRSKMAQVGIKLADISIITSEDPRGEWEKIVFQMETGAKKIGGVKNKNYYIIQDRQEAINFAIREITKKGDVVGIFGKGHEKSMNLDGKTEVSWSDVEVVKGILRYGK